MDAVARGEPGARADLHLPAVGNVHHEARRHQRAPLRLQHQRLGERGAEVGARRAGRLIGGQVEAFGMGQAADADAGARGAHGVSVSANRRAMSSASRSATAPFGILGHSSTPSRETSRTVFASPPMTSPDTSLATMRSAPLRSSLAVAFSRRSLVSAAKPTTSAGRRGPVADRAQDVGILDEAQVRRPLRVPS